MIDLQDYRFEVSAAGRINLIGEHIDYCGGKVLPCALSMKCTVYARPNGTDFINLEWTDLSGKVALDIRCLESYKDLPHAKYQAGCAYVWHREGHEIKGCDLLIDCHVPFGSGLSSSAAIEVATIGALALVAGEKELDPVEIALAARQAEHEFAGVNCGIMDQYASACGKKDHAMLLDCKTLSCEQIPMQTGAYSFVIINSHKPHSLVESKYNERREETEQAFALLKRRLRDIECLADVRPFKLVEYKTGLLPTLYRRARHVVDECERVNQAVTALRTGDMKRFGELLTESHRSLAEQYEVTGRELDCLAHAAWDHYACAGSRMVGGGFGGCTISLVRTDAVDDFKRKVCARYQKETGYEATCYDAETGDGLTYREI